MKVIEIHNDAITYRLSPISIEGRSIFINKIIYVLKREKQNLAPSTVHRYRTYKYKYRRTDKLRNDKLERIVRTTYLFEYSQLFIVLSVK